MKNQTPSPFGTTFEIGVVYDFGKKTGSEPIADDISTPDPLPDVPKSDIASMESRLNSLVATASESLSGIKKIESEARQNIDLANIYYGNANLPGATMEALKFNLNRTTQYLKEARQKLDIISSYSDMAVKSRQEAMSITTMADEQNIRLSGARNKVKQIERASTATSEIAGELETEYKKLDDGAPGAEESKRDWQWWTCLP